MQLLFQGDTNGYADFVTFVRNTGPHQVYYTASGSSPYFIYAVFLGGSVIAEVRVGSLPTSFDTDFPGAIQLATVGIADTGFDAIRSITFAG